MGSPSTSSRNSPTEAPLDLTEQASHEPAPANKDAVDESHGLASDEATELEIARDQVVPDDTGRTEQEVSEDHGANIEKAAEPDQPDAGAKEANAAAEAVSPETSSTAVETAQEPTA